MNNLREVMSAPNFHFVHGDIRNIDLVSYVLKTHEIDTVMHFAAFR
jgi:dTDP-D-glucose 4,6-dehydratase